jgi:hypothetical protein
VRHSGPVRVSMEVGSETGVLKLRYLQTTDDWHTWYPLLGLDNAMSEMGLTAIENPQSQVLSRIARLVSRLRLIRNIRRSSDGPIFVAMMGYSEGRTFPFSYGAEIVPYVFDCWPNEYGRWTAFFKRHKVRLAFFSARQSAEYFRHEIPAMRSVWLPEAVDPSAYHSARPLADREVDVLELGRKYDLFHSQVVGGLAESGKVHLFERFPQARIYPTRQDLIDGLASSRISVCFPRSMTHPGYTEGVETVTHRYFESMASGCIILGHCPAELSDLFGYNPVVEVEWGNEAAQVEQILAKVESHQDQVHANYRRLLEVGTWRHRAQTVNQEMKVSA